MCARLSKLQQKDAGEALHLMPMLESNPDNIANGLYSYGLYWSMEHMAYKNQQKRFKLTQVKYT